MKSAGNFSKLIACGVAATAMLLASSAEAAVNRAIVRAIRGTAEYSVAGAPWKTLRVGQALNPTTSVKTGVSSQVDLFLGDNGPTVRLLADTTLGLDKLNIDRTGVDVVIETFLDLQTGTIQGNVKQLASVSKYEVKTPFTVCAIKGTEYQISADGVLHVIKGAVLVAYGPPGAVQTATINAGQTFVPRPSTAPPNTPPTVRPTSPDDNLQPTIPADFVLPSREIPPTWPPVKVSFEHWTELGKERVFEHGPQAPIERTVQQVRQLSPKETVDLIIKGGVNVDVLLAPQLPVETRTKVQNELIARTAELPVAVIVDLIEQNPIQIEELIKKVVQLPPVKQVEVRERLLAEIKDIPPPVRDLPSVGGFISPTTGRPAG